MTTKRYTDEQLKIAVSESSSVMEVMRKLGMKMAGGSHSHLSKRIRKLGFDTSHFTGQAHNKGKHSLRKLEPQAILVVLPGGSSRVKRYQLERALLELDVPYKCEICGLSEWLGRKITLPIDHISGDWLDNRFENLRFLCPNCHSQTETFGYHLPS